MYFLLAGVMDRFTYIKYGLAGVLVFIGNKMVWINEAFGGKFPISWSLGVIASLIGISIIASLLRDENERKSAKASNPLNEARRLTHENN